MKWNGTVSQDCQMTMPTRFATANTPHASSSRLGLGKAVPRMADGLDRRLRAELLAQAADADLDDVRAGIEVVAPHLGEQALAADDLARMLQEVVQEAELPVGEVGRAVVERGPAPRQVERQPPHAQDVGLAGSRAPQVGPDARDELVEGEG